MKKKLQDTSLDTFDDILNDGTLGEMSEKARMLVEDNPGKTVRELLQIGIDDEIYSRSDRNLIAPRITLLAEEGIIIRPRKRICTVSGRRVMVHELAPMAWKEQRAELYRTEESRKFVKNRLEIESSKNPDIIHTVIEWTDGSVSCTCHDLYHRTPEARCHHALGMIQAISGKSPKEIELEQKLKELQAEHEIILTECIELQEQIIDTVEDQTLHIKKYTKLKAEKEVLLQKLKKEQMRYTKLKMELEAMTKKMQHYAAFSTSNRIVANEYSKWNQESTTA